MTLLYNKEEAKIAFEGKIKPEAGDSSAGE